MLIEQNNLTNITSKRQALLLCWPNYDSKFAYNAVRFFKGDTFYIY